MKNVIKSIGLLLALSMLIIVASCGDDDDEPKIVITEGTHSVSNGLYVGVDSETPVSGSNLLSLTKVEGPSFGTQDRAGHYTGYMFLAAGSYVFMDIVDQETEATYGGASSTYDDDAGDNTDDYTGAYTVVDGLSSSTAPFAVASSGMYHVIFDTQMDEALIVAIESWGAIGGAVYESACVSNGFNSDVDVTEVSSNATDGAVYTGSGIILNAGEFKVRYNDNWKIVRRIDIALPTDDTVYEDQYGYVALTNLGGTLGALEEGGANIVIGDSDTGTFDVTVTISNTGLVTVSIAKTGDAPTCAFDPDNFTWGIIGAATQPDGWDSDKKLAYADGNDGVHKWRAVFPLNGGGTDNNQFKFRTDDTWATKLLPTTVTVTDNTNAAITDDGETNSDGQWYVADGASGLYYFEITTADFGVTWNMTIDEAVWEVIGAASPGGWDAGTVLTYGDDLASASASMAMTADEYKFRANGAWDYNLGGALDALVYNGGNLSIAGAGTYTMTMTTADGGVTWTATAAQ